MDAGYIDPEVERQLNSRSSWTALAQALAGDRENPPGNDSIHSTWSPLDFIPYGEMVMGAIPRNAAISMAQEPSIGIGEAVAPQVRKMVYPSSAANKEMAARFQGTNLGKLLEGKANPWQLSPQEWGLYLRDQIPQVYKNAKGKFELDPFLENASRTTSELVKDKTGIPFPNAPELQSNYEQAVANSLADQMGIKAPTIMKSDAANIIRNAEGFYAPDMNTIVLRESYPFEPRKLETLAHEMEHAKDFSLFPYNEIKNEASYYQKFNPYFLTKNKRDFLIQQGKGHTLQGTEPLGEIYDTIHANNPWAAGRIRSFDHFRGVGHFESEYPLRELGADAMKQGADVHPEILKLFPQLKQLWKKPQGD